MREEGFHPPYRKGQLYSFRRKGGEAFILPRLELTHLPVVGYFATVGMILGTPRPSCFACLLEDVDPSNGRIR